MNQLIIAALGLGAAFLISRRGAEAAPPSEQLPSGQQQVPGRLPAPSATPFEAPDDAYNIFDQSPPSTAPGADPYKAQPGASPVAPPRAEALVKPEPKPTPIPATQVTRGALIVPVTDQPRIT
tara:strand:- start:1688 stop:2056 length:369 start_codon:yes stop_codon:yes gene_type:complete